MNTAQHKTIKDNPELLNTALATKGISEELDEKIAISKQKLKALQETYDKTKTNIEDLREAKKEYLELLLLRPNEPLNDVPIGNSTADNVIAKEHGTIREFLFPIKDHKEIGKKLGMMSFSAAALMSGSRFVILKGLLAQLERALISFMLDIAIQNGHEEISPPLLVKDRAMYGAGQLPKFEDESFKTSGHRLIPTAEVPLVNLVATNIFQEKELPIRYTACTPCFRKEAGSAGKDTSGMIRLHQFYKVELVSITTEKDSENELERITKIAESILEKLELPYRRVLLCTGDMGFSAAKTYDIEVWVPSQNTYREISSCSNCTDFQAKRMKTKYRTTGNDKVKKFVHTLNGSALAVGRLMVAILEEYQNKDGEIIVPKALKPYFNIPVIK